jgi:hypothetical protein
MPLASPGVRNSTSKRIFLGTFLALLATLALRAADEPKGERIELPQFPSEASLLAKMPPQPPDLTPEKLKLWFSVGETLEYKVYWGFIPVALSRATTSWEEKDGRKWIVMRFRTVSNDTLTKLYPVNDTIESWIDPETFLPFKFNKKLNEGKYKCDETTLFDRVEKMAYFRSNLSEKRWAFHIKDDTRDLPSFMCFMRKGPFEEGKKKSYELMADEKLYDLVLSMDEYEKIKLSKYGKVESLKCVPEAAFNGMFVRKGKMTLWVSKDPRHVATMMEADTPFANVKLKLYDVSGPGQDFWIKNKEEDD